jgi:hypothetical protein
MPTAWDTDRDLQNAGYVVFPAERYIDPAHGIDWAIILWRCSKCGAERHSPGPGEPCHCVHGHGPMRAVNDRKTPTEWCKAKSIRIFDPDGWRSDSDPDWNEPISEADFDRRAGISTAGPWDWGHS